jgi:transcriptional regulator with XRE-family HTH domain
MHIGEKIKKVREQKGLSQAELAKRVGIGQSYVSKIENQAVKALPPQLVEDLARAFNINIVELLDETSYATEKIAYLKEGIGYCPNTSCVGSNITAIELARIDAVEVGMPEAMLGIPDWEPYKTPVIDEDGEPINFCIHCGTKLVSECLNCGRKIRPPSRHCPGCGEAVFRSTDNPTDDDDVPF